MLKQKEEVKLERFISVKKQHPKYEVFHKRRLSETNKKNYHLSKHTYDI